MTGTTRVGDWLLVFDGRSLGGGAPAAGRTEAPWRRVARWGAREDSPALWVQEPSEHWAGAPWRIDEATPEAWIYGERHGVGAGAGDGRFTRIARRRTAPTLDITTDRFGTQHVYRTRHADETVRAIGSSFRAVAALAPSRALDWQGLTSFCACGFFLGDRTPLESVRIVRPARRLRFDDDGTLRADEATWSWRHAPIERPMREVVAEYHHLLESAVHARLGPVDDERASRTALPLSGGLDSRSLLAVASAARPWCYAYGWSERSIETRIARRLARRRDLDLETFVLGPSLFEGGQLDAVAAATEGFSDVVQCRQAAVAAPLRRGADAVLGGHWGDVWHDAMLPPGVGPAAAAGEALLDRAVAKVWKAGREPLLEALCAPRLDEPPARLVRRLVADELERVDGIDDPDLRLKAFKTEQWSFRWTLSSIRAYQLAVVPRLPFYDARLADFFLGLPTATVAGRRLQIEHLKRHAPDLARVRWQQAGASLYLAPFHSTLLVPKRAVEKLGRLLTRHRPIERHWEVEFAGARGRRGLERHLLAPGLRLHEHLEPATIRAWVDAIDASLRRGRPDPGLGSRLTTLLTLSLALERLP